MLIPNRKLRGIWWRPRELEIIRLIADSKVNKEIGVQLGISESTVKFWVCHIIRKLGLEDGIASSKRVKIARWAIENKVVRPARLGCG